MAYLLQIACITILAEALLRLIPVRAAGFRYAYWRLVLAGSLVAPWLLRTTLTPGPAIEFVPMGPVAAALDDAAVARAWSETGAAWLNASWVAVVPWLLVAGTVFRLLWVGVGIMHLRAWRRAGEPIVDSLYEEIQHRLGTRAELRSVADFSQPVTFGLRRPVVLLPESLRLSSEAIRRAVVTHELVHVRRRDWLWVLGEEALRAVLWFHPAVWWLTSRIRLTREEFTDHIAVLASGSRRHYLEALVAFADTVQLEPAPAFARRAHLFHRITLLSTEPVMSARRVVFSGALVAMLLVTGGWYASEAFPVVVEPRLEASAPTPAPPQANSQSVQAAPRPVTPENPIPRRIVAPAIPYPNELSGTGMRGVIELRIVLNASGSIAAAARNMVAVAPAKPVSDEERYRAADAFVAAAIDGVRRWQYDAPFEAPLAFYVTIMFAPDSQATAAQSDGSRPLTAAMIGGRTGGGPLPVGRSGGPSVARAETTLTVPAPQAPPRSGGPVRIGGAIRPPLQTKKVDPVYPPIAQSARVSGVVILEIQVDEQGKVRDPRVLRSIPLLDQAALDAVSQWEYQPVLLNGAPVPVIMTVTVEFSLQF
jgi:TonB family protein